MADVKKVQGLIQMHTDIFEPKFLNHINAAIEMAWGYLAMMAEWWFLEQAEPYQINVTANDDTYEINRKNVGLMLHVANDSGRRIWVYKSRRSYQLYLRQPTDAGALSSDTATGSSVVVFTLRGVKQGKPFIQVRPIPSQAQTVYLHYQEAGVLGNLDRLPAAWTKVLIHLAMSVIAKPKQIHERQWLATTFKHEEQFREAFADMLKMEGGVVDEARELELDDHIAARMEEIHDLY